MDDLGGFVRRKPRSRYTTTLWRTEAERIRAKSEYIKIRSAIVEPEAVGVPWCREQIIASREFDERFPVITSPSVQRYSMTWCGEHDEMMPNDKYGEWVKYQDYLNLVNQRND